MIRIKQLFFSTQDILKYGAKILYQKYPKRVILIGRGWMRWGCKRAALLRRSVSKSLGYDSWVVPGKGLLCVCRAFIPCLSICH